MIEFKARKLWGGDVSVQSFIVEYAKKMKQKIKIVYENGYMIIDAKTPYKITAPPQLAQRTDKYIHKGTAYQLYDYLWNPVAKEERDYTAEGIKQLSEVWKRFKNKLDKQDKLI